MDTQVVELLGRNKLVDELLRAGLEVALPFRDRGVDLIAYADLDRQVEEFRAVPIQLKASRQSGFGVHKKYERIRNLIIAHLWYIEDPAKQVTFAMSYPEAVAIAEKKRWTLTASWIDKGGYASMKPDKALREMLEPYRMNSDRWWSLVSKTARV